MRSLLRIAIAGAAITLAATPFVTGAQAQTAAGINAANNATSATNRAQGNPQGLHLNRTHVSRQGQLKAGPGSAMMTRGNAGEATSSGTNK